MRQRHVPGATATASTSRALLTMGSPAAPSAKFWPERCPRCSGVAACKYLLVYNGDVLDLKSKLAAAGIVTQEQLKDFDERASKAREVARTKSKTAPSKPRPQRSKGTPRAAKDKPVLNVQALKKLNRGEAYDRIRKVVAQRRLDDGERTIPGPDDEIFNFVTATGRIGRLYLRAETVAALREGTAAISSFMSHHGLAHCVLPKDIALGIAEVFPLWLRNLKDHPAAGQLEAPPAKDDAEPEL